MIHGRDRLRRTSDDETFLPQAGKGLRRCDLVDQVEVAVEDVGAARLACDDVTVPDLVEKSSLVHRSAMHSAIRGVPGEGQTCARRDSDTGKGLHILSGREYGNVT